MTCSDYNDDLQCTISDYNDNEDCNSRGDDDFNHDFFLREHICIAFLPVSMQRQYDSSPLASVRWPSPAEASLTAELTVSAVPGHILMWHTLMYNTTLQ